MKFVVDTHALIWFFADDKRLGSNARVALNSAESELIVPAIVLAELYWLLEHRLPMIAMDKVNLALDRDRRFSLYPLDREVIEISSSLTPIGEMHDRLIAATALAVIRSGSAASLITRDVNLSESVGIDVIW